MNNFDPTNNISWQLGHRGRVAVFIDGNNLFHAARFHNIDIDYNKLLRVLLGDGRLLRAFFYTGVDVGAYFIDLGEIADRVRKDLPHGQRYDERELHEPAAIAYADEQLAAQQVNAADVFQSTMRVVLESTVDAEDERFEQSTEYVR